MVCNLSSAYTNNNQKSALYRRFFDSGLLITARLILLLFPLLTHAGLDQANCVATSTGEATTVKYVIDGDTVILSDDRKVRLIGIDTPEIGYGDHPSGPGAIQAKNFLKQLLAQNPSVYLIYDQEHFDRHNRTLAHLFLSNNDNVQATLLREGLATPLTIPPNLQFIDCYRQQSNKARESRRGLWALPRHQPVSVERLSGTERGFYIITGKVKRVTESRSSIWINLGARAALRIQRKDLPYFKGMDLHDLAGKQVLASGWLYKRNNQLRMRLHHHADLQVTGITPGN
jgi:endonuclease YncB( thermonuclease family)